MSIPVPIYTCNIPANTTTNTGGTIIYSNITSASGYTYYPINIYQLPTTIQLDLELPEEENIDEDHSSGCKCLRCNEFNEYAQPNQPDKTFICYACRNGL